MALKKEKVWPGGSGGGGEGTSQIRKKGDARKISIKGKRTGGLAWYPKGEGKLEVCLNKTRCGRCRKV